MKIYKKSSGFTLIEAIATMVILTFAMTGALYLLSNIILMTAKNEKRLVATYLAQECTELVRNARDTAWKQRLPWDWAFQSTNPNPKFIIETDHTQSALPIRGKDLGIMLKEITTSDAAFLYVDGSTYTHSISGKKSIYKRTINVEKKATNLIALKCIVEWDYHNNNEQIEIGTILTNWYK